MQKFKISALMAGAALALGLAGSAQALTLTAGNYKITLDTYDSGTTYGNSAGLLCNSAAACDTAAVSKAPGSVGSSNGSADTMGIISVTAITNLATGLDEYIRGTASTIGGVSLGPYLTGVFANLTDRTVETACGALTCTTTALATGGGFKLWSNTSNYNPTLGP